MDVLNWFTLLNVSISVAIIAAIVATYFRLTLLNRTQGRGKSIEKQIDMVYELVNYIQQNPFEVSYSRIEGRGSSGTTYNVTIFEVPEIRKNDSEFRKYDDMQVLFTGQCNQVLDLQNFIDSSYLPKKIADKLLNFNCTRYDKIEMDDLKNTEYVMLIRSKFYIENIFNKKSRDKGDNYKRGNNLAYLSWLSFEKCSIQLKKEIEEWASKNKVELNIRADFKN